MAEGKEGAQGVSSGLIRKAGLKTVCAVIRQSAREAAWRREAAELGVQAFGIEKQFVVASGY
jgi:hypothetical protein